MYPDSTKTLRVKRWIARHRGGVLESLIGGSILIVIVSVSGLIGRSIIKDIGSFFAQPVRLYWCFLVLALFLIAIRIYILAAKRQPSLTDMPGYDADYGIKIGGTFNNAPLKMISSDWKKSDDMGRIKSGWLYSPDRYGSSHAVTFFKIHVFDDHTGYLHIADVADPEHTIWMKTTAGSCEDGKFCWTPPPGAKTVDRWKFCWKSDS